MVIDGVPDQAKPTGFDFADGRSRVAGRVSRPEPAQCFRPQARLAGCRDNQGVDRATLAATVVAFKPTVRPRNPAASKYRVVPTSW